MERLIAAQLIKETCDRCGVKFDLNSDKIDTTSCGIPKKFAIMPAYSGNAIPLILQIKPVLGGGVVIGAVNFDNLDICFKKDGVVKASSTHLRLPLALLGETSDLFYRNNFNGQHAIYKKLTTAEELKEWLENFPAELEVMRVQHKELSDVLKQIKTEGQQYKDIIKEYGLGSTKGREARNTYEDMILQKIRKLTKREEILKAQRGFVL